MRLMQWLDAKNAAGQGVYWQPFGSAGSVQVFSRNPILWTMRDFIVTSVVSGPSVIMVPRDTEDKAAFDEASEEYWTQPLRPRTINVAGLIETLNDGITVCVKRLGGKGGWPVRYVGVTRDDVWNLAALFGRTLLTSFPSPRPGFHFVRD